MLISFITKRTKDTKGSEIDICEFLNFVLFVTFVVQCVFRFWVTASLLCARLTKTTICLV